jgi:hypothetical protein
MFWYCAASWLPSDCCWPSSCWLSALVCLLVRQVPVHVGFVPPVVLHALPEESRQANATDFVSPGGDTVHAILPDEFAESVHKLEKSSIPVTGWATPGLPALPSAGATTPRSKSFMSVCMVGFRD